MKICVFLGPSLPPDDAKGLLDAIYLPPVRRGDVRRAVADHAPDAIAIIDGFFEQVPSVWHKELLWAIDQGIDLWGASSMGALRAAELAQFGMRGHGRVFEAYKSGRFEPFEDAFEDDDEVAVVHGPEWLSHVSTEAMVDIRATLAAAEDAQVIDRAMRESLTGVAKGLFYKRRRWPIILEGSALAPEEHARLTEWLPEGRMSQKRLDAEGLLRLLSAGTEPADPPPFHFEHTLLWEIAEAAYQR